MTIELRRGDMFESGAEALVCAANAQGRLGAGQALEVKRRFPREVALYAWSCREGDVKPGHTWTLLPRGLGPVIFFAAVKGDPRQPARLEWVEGCAASLALWCGDIMEPGEAVAVPALGCGLGGLRWTDVRPILERMAEAATGVRWLLYEPLEETRRELVAAIARRLEGHGGLRANAWESRDGRHLRIYLAQGKSGLRLGWIAVDDQLRLTADGPMPDRVPTAWLSMAEAVKAEVLR